jgi:hypothetical protein
MWEIGFPILAIFVIPLIAYWIRPREIIKLVHRLTPQRVQRYLKNPELDIRDYGFIYMFGVLFAGFFIVISFGEVMNVVLGNETLSPEDVKRLTVLFLGFAIIIAYVGLFFTKYFNEKVWRQSKRDSKLGLDAVLYFIETGRRLVGIGLPLFAFSYLFLVVGFSPFSSTKSVLPQVLNTFLIYIAGSVLCLSTCCLTIGRMLKLDKSNVEITTQLLEWFKDYEPAKDKMKDSLFLPRVIDYSKKEMAEKLGCEDLNLKKPFELLYLTRVCGNASEKEEVSNTIDELIKASKAKESWRFIEILRNAKENPKLSYLRDILDSSSISFVREKRNPQKFLTAVTVMGFILALISTIITVLGYLGIHVF